MPKTKAKKEIKLEDLNFPPYLEVRTQIDKKLGKRPRLPEDLPKGAWTEQSLRVLSERYLYKDKEGAIIETPEEMCWRVAWEIASAEVLWGKDKSQVIEIARKYYLLLASHEFLPNSPTLMNAGTGNRLQYSACFVLPVEDSLVGIFDALKWQALIHQTGGGTGFSFSRLRPKGSMVKSSKGTASGPVSFMRIFDAATNEVKQGGKRRGANMGILRVDHPDIMEFIHCKEEGGITNFNISVAITNKFMEAFKKDKNYDLINPKNGEKVGEVSARKVFEEIVNGAWRTGDPGLIFIDRINAGSANPTPSLGPVESTNPCGEQPLYPFDSCNLGSIFLTYFVKEDGGKAEVDWEKLKQASRLAVRFLDGVIEMNPYTLESIRRTTLAIRRVGLGVGGWADMLVALGIAYDSEKALSLAEKIMKTVQQEAEAETIELARERGPFPLWPVSIYKSSAPRRNSTVTTIAPTGSISIIAGASSGIEPLFAIAYQHIVKDKHLERKLSFVNPKFEEVARKKGFWSDGLREKVGEEGVVRQIAEIPEDVRQVFGTAHEIDPTWHVKMQSAFQKYTENAVSKTINLSHDATVEDVKKAYLSAWETGCRGITIFRDGSKDAQVLNLGVKDTVEEGSAPLRERPLKVMGVTYKLMTPVGSAFVTINQDATGDPLEVFINVGKAGSDVAAMAEALGRTISTALRFRGSLNPREKAKEIAHQLSGIGGRRSVGFGPNKIRSLPDAISVALSTHYGFRINGNGHSEATSHVAGAVMAASSSAPAEQTLTGSSDPTMASAAYDGAAEAPNGGYTNGHLANGKTHANGVKAVLDLETTKSSNLSFGIQEATGDICPSCGASALVYEEGCSKCHACGHSEC
ncbi:ribonucleoside-diphosphate reductase, adenosylcobalamin-dependent [Candidatus Woesebacteria bacterium RBG_19FT_COMBO_47_8]|uniref:Vitamin B12-dependent ribonucleotide reductase n=1 Tax=Candidatus Woesebacteria bacterium RBG_13_46_13 TaxID=1802479 RepID=A0A1F7X562_9BACT|nr:MAG: ribonucleoside-diphosphate reductase, adenosylcobalamin-dependent [Candidatus Woesebacteria bacterium RBG_13_46_13]OGM17985.1 MAG: ribonucleoside-diphosphate reductase, adenosylcobalamin-dependent [Candidatus Woesebacteria bacterium RBG_19FT_COMBO_47_8]HJX59269.1 vitamin B12-dependent ribonucleotide reductase [Patescibacteria group bacterium]